MKRTNAAAALFAVVLIAGMSFMLFNCQSQTFVGNMVKNQDSYELDMEQMNCTDAHTLDLQAGDSLQVTLAIVVGTLQLEITAPDSSVLYSGNGTEATRFTVNISQSGRYTIAVKAHHAQGTVRVCKRSAAIKAPVGL